MVLLQVIEFYVVDELPGSRIKFSDHWVLRWNQHCNAGAPNIAESPPEPVSRFSVPRITEQLHFVKIFLNEWVPGQAGVTHFFRNVDGVS